MGQGGAVEGEGVVDEGCCCLFVFCFCCMYSPFPLTHIQILTSSLQAYVNLLQPLLIPSLTPPQQAPKQRQPNRLLAPPQNLHPPKRHTQTPRRNRPRLPTRLQIQIHNHPRSSPPPPNRLPSPTRILRRNPPPTFLLLFQPHRCRPRGRQPHNRRRLYPQTRTQPPPPLLLPTPLPAPLRPQPRPI